MCRLSCGDMTVECGVGRARAVAWVACGVAAVSSELLWRPPGLPASRVLASRLAGGAFSWSVRVSVHTVMNYALHGIRAFVMP